MGLTYRYSESTVAPDEIEVGKSTVYFRKDVAKEERMVDEEHTQTFYIYQEATMPLKDFLAMANNQIAVNAVLGKDDSKKISNIESNGIDSNGNQLIIMEAMADLYDAIASLMS